MSDSSVTVVDDQAGDDNLTYDGTWGHLYGLNAVNGTLSYTVDVGASVTFRFNGTGVGVVGALSSTNGSAGPVSLYTLDDRSPFTFTAPSNLTSTIYSQTFFLVESLSASKEHTLVINVTHASVSASFLLDYIGYVPVSLGSSNTSLTATIPAPTKPPVEKNVRSSTPVGAIVGGVVGGVVLLAVVAVTFLLIRRRGHGRPGLQGTTPDSETKPSTPALASPGYVDPLRHASTVGLGDEGTHPVQGTHAPAHMSTAPVLGSSNLRQFELPLAHPLSTKLQVPPAPMPPSAHAAQDPPLPAPPVPLPEPDLFSDIQDDVPPEYTEH